MSRLSGPTPPARRYSCTGARPPLFLPFGKDIDHPGVGHLAYLSTATIAQEDSPQFKEMTTSFMIMHQFEHWARFGLLHPRGGQLDADLAQLDPANPRFASLARIVDFIATTPPGSYAAMSRLLMEHGRLLESLGRFLRAADAYEMILRFADGDYDQLMIVQAAGRCAICLDRIGDKAGAR